MDHLIDHFYIGNAADARDMVLLRQAGIRVVINLSGVSDPVYDGLQYFQLNQPDNAPVSSHIATLFFGFIDSLAHRKGVLIHCAAGVSRTAAFTTALLVRRYGLSWENALSLVKEKRPSSNPSAVLLDSLRDHLTSHSP